MKGYLSVTFRDSFLQETVRRYELVETGGFTTADELADLHTEAGKILSAIAPLTGATITGVSLVVTETNMIPNNLGKPELGSNVSDDGVLSVALLGGGKGTLRVPAPSSSKVDAVGKPDLTEDGWSEFSALFQLGASGMLSDGETVDAQEGILGILKTWRASRGRRNN